MKNVLLILIVIFSLSACQKLEDLNINTKDLTKVPAEAIFTGAQKNVFDQLLSTNVNVNVFRFFSQYWTETTYLDEVNYDIVTRPIPQTHWNTIYRTVLKDFDESAKVLAATPLGVESQSVRNNKAAIIEIMTVFSWKILVETFGNIPYSEALDVNNVHPKYDDALTIYKDLISRLTAAIGKIDQTAGSLGTADNMYKGDAAKWYRFANSLKLKMGLLLADVDNATSKAAVESAAPNVFKSNSDNAAMPYLLSQPNTNPVYVDVIASGRNDFVPANTIVDAMNSLNDPRLSAYFSTIGGNYVGGKYGASNSYAAYSHISDAIVNPTFEGLIMDYSEVEFALAEASERGFTVGGTAQSHYNNAITASLLYWSKYAANPISSADISNYLANPSVAYTTAAGGFKQKIGTQQWIAYYNRGFEAWTEWRMLEYPQLIAPSAALSVIPLRYTYPTTEQTLNPDSYKAASAAIGGDLVSTKLFFKPKK